MAKRKQTIVKDTKFSREYSMIIGKHEVNKGDTIKVAGQYGCTFKFYSLTTNVDTGKQWVDCFELHRGITGMWRSFNPEDIKVVRTVKKRVKR